VQETQPAADVTKANLNQCIVMNFESLVGLPVHAFGFTTLAIQNSSLPPKAFANFVGFG
jgi:hypothetical protein